MLDIDKIYCGDCLDLIKEVADGSVDCICTDPPYLYLDKDVAAWDESFDEDGLFEEWKRVLKPNGMIILFGRGESFYRWNTKLIQLGFPFKEEVIWFKRRNTSPVTAISRVHETVSILGKRKINMTYVPAPEYFEVNMDRLVSTLEHIEQALGSPKRFEVMRRFLESTASGDGETPNLDTETQDDWMYYKSNWRSFNVTTSGALDKMRKEISFIKMLEQVREQSVIHLNESSFGRVHPTQKPVRLIERLLNLACDKGSLVLDCFIGSGTTGLACQNTGRHFIGFEKDKQFYESALKRINTNVKLF